MVDRSSFDSFDFDFLWNSLIIIVFGMRIEVSSVSSTRDVSSIVVYKVEQSVFELLDTLLVELLIINSAELECDFEFEFVVDLFHNSLYIQDSFRTGQPTILYQSLSS